jgi:electron transfer flavoprotein beta subunit
VSSLKIIVCVKQVPDTTEVRINQETGTLIREGVPSIMNPDDKAAMELALRMKELKPEIFVHVLTMGPKQAERVLIEALCMGADEATLLSDRKFAGADTWATSTALAGAIGEIGADIVLCGRQAIDGDTAQVGPQIAEHLNLAQATYVSDAALGGEGVLATRKFEDGDYKLELPLPCLLTTLAEEIEVRYMHTHHIVRTMKERKIQLMTADDLKVDQRELGLKGSPTRVKKSVTKSAKSAGIRYMENPEVGVEKIVDYVKGLNIL